MSVYDRNNEADRIVGNMCRVPGFNGTTTPEIVDEIFLNFSNPIYCNGYLRDMVFTPITKNTIAFKTVASK